MSLNKNKMVREIGRRTRLKNRDVQQVLETLIDVWTEELVSGGKIELENFLVLETKIIDRGMTSGILQNSDNKYLAPRKVVRVSIRASKSLRSALKTLSND